MFLKAVECILIHPFKTLHERGCLFVPGLLPCFNDGQKHWITLPA